jgi:predicted TIM-barrel fold metal-dependent hydrolase
MIIDFHTHIFPQEIRHKRESFFSGERAFKLLYESPKSKLVGAESLIESMDQYGVDHAVVFGFPWQSMEICRRHNDYILKAVHRNPHRLSGFGCVDPFGTGAAKEVERCLGAGLKGVGELAFYRSGIDEASLDRLTPIMALCQTKQLPVMIHTNEPVGHHYPGKTPNTLHQIYQLAKRFPDNRIVLAHWGGGIFFYQLLKKEVRQSLQNIYYDTAASPFLYRPDIWCLASALAGADKILLGTDYPLLGPQRYLKEIDACGLGAAERAKIVGGNAALLLGLDTA